MHAVTKDVPQLGLDVKEVYEIPLEREYAFVFIKFLYFSACC